jgi:hypothetical protein
VHCGGFGSRHNAINLCRSRAKIEKENTVHIGKCDHYGSGFVPTFQIFFNYLIFKKQDDYEKAKNCNSNKKQSIGGII